MSSTIPIPYDDFTKLSKDSADKEATIALLKTEFPDDTCQLIAIKSLLGVTDEQPAEEEPTPAEPVEGGDSNDESGQ